VSAAYRPGESIRAYRGDAQHSKHGGGVRLFSATLTRRSCWL